MTRKRRIPPSTSVNLQQHNVDVSTNSARHTRTSGIRKRSKNASEVGTSGTKDVVAHPDDGCCIDNDTNAIESIQVSTGQAAYQRKRAARG